MARERRTDRKARPENIGIIKETISVGSAKKIAEVLFEMRKQAGLTQSQLAERLEISQSRIAVLESSAIAQTPSFDVVARVAEACGYKMELLFRRNNARERQQ
jgi:transcriptional regulator with XRE-family HTH domain